MWQMANSNKKSLSKNLTQMKVRHLLSVNWQYILNKAHYLSAVYEEAIPGPYRQALGWPQCWSSHWEVDSPRYPPRRCRKVRKFDPSVAHIGCFQIIPGFISAGKGGGVVVDCRTDLFFSMYCLERSCGHQYVDSFVECEGLNQFGRFSFNKFNREVEVSN